MLFHPPPHEQSFERLPEVLQQMPAIRHLHRLRCAARHPLNDRGAAVATDEANRRMRREPLGNRRRGAVGQDIERSVLVVIDDETSIDTALAQCEVVDTNTLRGADSWQRRGTDEPQEDVGSRRHAKDGGQTCSRLAAEREGDPFEGGVQGMAATASGGDEGREPFREDAAWAARIAAEEAADRKDEREGDAAEGEIGDVSLIVAVDAVGTTIAERAAGSLANRGGSDGDVNVTAAELVDAESGEMRKEGGEAHDV